MEVEGRGAVIGDSQASPPSQNRGLVLVTNEDVWRQYQELQEVYSFADSREERLHIAGEMNDNMRQVPDDAPFEAELYADIYPGDDYCEFGCMPMDHGETL